VHKDSVISTDGQGVDVQVRQLTKAGCKKVFRETAIGVKTDHSQLRKARDQRSNPVVGLIVFKCPSDNFPSL
jgi:hypothetical protein